MKMRIETFAGVRPPPAPAQAVIPVTPSAQIVNLRAGSAALQSAGAAFFVDAGPVFSPPQEKRKRCALREKNLRMAERSPRAS